MVPAAQSLIGMATQLECMDATPLQQFLDVGANLLRRGTEISGPLIEIFNRMVLHISHNVEFAEYKLAKLANDQFENLCFWKLADKEEPIAMLKNVDGTRGTMWLRVKNGVR